LRFLIDEMFPAAVCERLTDLGHDDRALASMLDRWAVANPQPWIGLHWPADP
jgi:hypothetical protein